ncbi:hypothetical protein UA08_04324 [Talaromyces atroroseus]|uniref:Uncharacterized protein n=1 Tax=Talaromyces atroroseus TaxID=1441469 RepID=A0A1Q5Q8Q0_TALAT|nr:hypothetical protein UA08_04324 [Talaromyces atroroseus]OKL60442.1 hypothetical protein UA08_04324 [Talaromyces atroroseus]
MSAEALPITRSAFAEAITELPLSSLYAKVSELRNSIAHLTLSNEEIRRYIIESEEGPDSQDNKLLESYVVENEEVMQAMAERIGLLKAEVEGRGQQWMDEVLTDGENNNDNAAEESAQLTNGYVDHEHVNGIATPSNQQNDGDDDEEHPDNDENNEGIYL